MRRSRGTEFLPTALSGRPALALGACCFGILALELALIRWVAAQIRIFAYFANLVLLAAFLGMGLGVAVGRRRPDLVRLALPALAVLSAILAFSERLGLVHLKFPDLSIQLWGAQAHPTLAGFLCAAALVFCLFWMITAVFALVATPVGYLFSVLAPLRAYAADLLGSLLGVIAMASLAVFGSPPAVWLSLAMLPVVWVSRRLSSVICALAVAALGVLSVKDAVFSPYNRLDLKPYHMPAPESGPLSPQPEWELTANRDFSQFLLDLSPRTVEATPPGSRQRFRQAVYELPFRLQPEGGSALVVGAGTGNDVAAALRSGYSRVTAVEIDPAILDLGRRLHPERPYSDSRVSTVVNDARAFFEQHPDERYDVVSYGLLDSHALFSSMTSLRLENYVYTVEGIRAGWTHVKEDGVLSIAFSVFAAGWLPNRMAGLIREATGMDPVLVLHGMNGAVTFVAARHLDARRLPRSLGSVVTVATDPRVRIPTDDWPFLYLRPGSFPFAYPTVLLLILATAAFLVRKAYRPADPRAGRFDLPLFLMGAAFMLLETRMVTALSLLFGSTWIVNASVFVGVLVMVLLANQAVARRAPRRPELWYLPLALSLLATWAVGPGILNTLSLLQRGLMGGLLYALPVAFAGMIFSCLLKRSRDTVGALGSNLLGAMFGGSLEYLSMFVGLRNLTLLALALYLGSFLFLVRQAVSRQEGMTAEVRTQTGTFS